ncbi:MAG: hypothetical protein KAJ18_03070 [Candidatus Omnitrophica bacterium]|nr:hypothetical protein [Candidatus Omnitrophota bacterium]
MNLNKKEIIQLSISGILLLILAVFLIPSIQKKAKKTRRAKSPVGITTETLAAQAGSEPDVVDRKFYGKLEKETEDLEVTRDPFFPAPRRTADETSSDLHLMGIAWDSVTPTAIINNRIVQIGTRIDKYTVIDIQKDRVILSGEQYNFELMLNL